MKYIITESKLETAIIEYINDLFPVDNINSTNPTEYDDETGENYDDYTRIEFYIGDYGDENTCFRWHDCEYFDSDGPARDICPTVSLEYQFEYMLTALFGDRWHEPFKNWFIKNFDLPIKTLDV